jgi:hypothetical protein
MLTIIAADGVKRFVVSGKDLLTAFLLLESGIRAFGELPRQAGECLAKLPGHENEHSISSNCIFTRVLCAFAQSAGGRPAAGWRLSRRQHSGGR